MTKKRLIHFEDGSSKLMTTQDLLRWEGGGGKKNLWKAGGGVVKRAAGKAIKKAAKAGTAARLRKYGKQIPTGKRFKNPTA